jgi:PHD/YefM family antitoxin component YafN of YafNO toxin-antitoxin module
MNEWGEGEFLMKIAQPEYLVDSRGKKKAVIVPVAEYRQMMEDLHDLAVVAERRKEGTVSLEEMRRRLRARGRV